MPAVRPANEPVLIAGQQVEPGERRRVDLPVAEQYGQAQVAVPTVVVNGLETGPRLFVSAAIHGDEILGVEIIRRLLRARGLRRLRGTLIAVPIVNVYGFINQDRYLPDRRDLNRSFPGSVKGSLASRLANVFMREVVHNSTHGIDLHTAAYHRVNLPQIRACLDQPETEKLARAFGVPVILNANLRDGSLRQAVLERQLPMLLYEAGGALRFDEVGIRAGVRGVLSVMHALGMIAAPPYKRPPVTPVIARSSVWLRAPESGILLTRAALGDRVRRGEVLGVISDPVDSDEHEVESPADGIVIARTDLPLVNEGDALFNIATFETPKRAAAGIEALQAELDPALVESPSGEPPIR